MIESCGQSYLMSSREQIFPKPAAKLQECGISVGNIARMSPMLSVFSGKIGFEISLTESLVGERIYEVKICDSVSIFCIFEKFV